VVIMDALTHESQYEELKKLARELHIPVAEAFWQLEVKDRNGRMIRTYNQRSHSWVRNAYNLLLCQAAAIPSNSSLGLAIVDTGGSTHSDSGTQPASGWSSNGASNMRIYVGSNYGFYAPAGVDSMGIVVGTGSGAENFNDHSLGARVSSGNGAGQLAYSAMDAPSISTVGTSKQVVWIRYFNNNSGGDITVNEAGIYTKGTVDGSTVYYMMCRDLLTGGVDIPDTGQLKVTYTVQLTYPA
jgi:hypothetical protein